MNRRRLIQALGLGALAGSTVHAAAPPSGRRRLAVLLFDNPESWDFLASELRKELADLGWVEGSNLNVEWRFAHGDTARLADLASQLARSGADAILTRGAPATRALKDATVTIPIVTGVGDPIGAGFARSLAEPGGNITGLSWAAVEGARKQVELLRVMLPRLSRLIIVLKADRSPFLQEMTSWHRGAAREIGLTSEVVLVTGATELQAAWQPGRTPGVTGTFVSGLGTSIAPKDIADLALRLRMPTVFDYSFYVEAGGLMSYRFNWENQTQRTAAQLDKVFRGAKPAQIPFEFPTRSEFVINRSTARSLGLDIPRELLLRADQIIE